MDTGPDTGRTADAGHEGAREFERYRRLLFSVAYDMLGSVADAEDCVQETWIRWARRDRSDVIEPRAYLVRITANTALNRMRTVRNRREAYVGPWLPEPLVRAPDAAEEVERAEEVSYALMVVLESLTPLERAVFVLREVFGFPHAEIAASLGRSEASVRQTSHRAREHVQARRPRFTPDPRGLHRLTERFLAAAAGGDVDGLKELLADDVVLVTDGGGRRRAALKPVHGADRVARFVIGTTPADGSHTVRDVLVNGDRGVLLLEADGTPSAVGTIEVREGRVTRVHIVRNPDKLPMRAPDRAEAGRGPGSPANGLIME